MRERTYVVGIPFISCVAICSAVRALALVAALLIVLNGCGGGGDHRPPLPPTISSVLPGSVSSTGAIITWSTDQAATSQVEYGTTTAYGSSTALDSMAVTNHSVALAGLTGGTTYHFRVKSGNANGSSVSPNSTFTTVTPAPTISNVAVGSLSITGATVTWSTDQASDSQVEYGTTTAYGSSMALDSAAVTSHSVQLSGLTGASTYHFRVKSGNANGNSVSPDSTFTTVSAANFTEVKAAPRTIAIVVHGDVTAADTNGLVTQLADAITADYAAKADSNDPVVSTTIIASPADAPGVLAGLQGVNNLWGIMLIGQVPAPLTNFPQGAVLFDEPYRVPDCSQYPMASDGTVTYPAIPWATEPACEKTAWLSRIYGTPTQVLAFIQKDLNTRHTAAPLQQYGYVRAGWFGGMAQPDMTTYWVNNGLYPSLADVKYVTTDGTTTYTSGTRLQQIEDLLASGTEFASIFVHGAPDALYVEGSGASGTEYSDDYTWFTSSQLLSVTNRARVINMISCNTGDFSNPNYFAGAALFGGDTLLVIANTTIFPMDFWGYEPGQVERKYHLLANGATFADIDVAQVGSVTEMFGDPTISLRSQPVGDTPALTVSIDGVNFSRYHGPSANLDVTFAQPSVGGAKVRQTILLGNGGKTDLAVQITNRAEFPAVNGEYPCTGSCGFGGGITIEAPNVWSGTCDTTVCHTVITIPAGKTTPVTFALEPIFTSTGNGTSTTLYGTTAGRFEIHTVDPRDGGLGASDPKLGRLYLYLSGNVKP